MGFSQSIFTASEDDGFVQMCAELLDGELGTDISILVGPGFFGNDSGSGRFAYNIIILLLIFGNNRW